MNEHRINTKLMGCTFELIVHDEDSENANRLLSIAVDEITRIENLLSEFKENTITTQLNRHAGESAVTCPSEVFQLIERCIKLSTLSRGAFDISMGPLKRIYNFKNKEFEFPKKKIIRQTLEQVGYQYIKFYPESNEVFLSKKNMSISFAAIGKGYAADCVKKIWLQEGVSSGVISASGDLTTIGSRQDGSPWKIGIANPDNKQNILFYIPVQNASVATSGDYEQYFMHGGTRYSHNINPINGLPVSGIKSVSVISPVAELCDALATAVYVMGIETGLDFINQLPDTHCLIINDDNKVFYSEKINISYEK